MIHHHPHRSPAALQTRGFSALELLITLAIAGIISTMAYPSFAQQIGKSRRADAMVAIATTQMAEERWRAAQPTYGSLQDIGMPPSSASGHYSVQVLANTASGYQVLATAVGAQLHDSECRNLRLEVAGGNMVYASGPDESVANAPALNRRCWSL